jgi:hypothetical protein
MSIEKFCFKITEVSFVFKYQYLNTVPVPLLFREFTWIQCTGTRVNSRNNNGTVYACTVYRTMHVPVLLGGRGGGVLIY